MTKELNSALVILFIGPSGVSEVSLDAETTLKEINSLTVYNKLRPAIKLIDTVLKGGRNG